MNSPFLALLFAPLLCLSQPAWTAAELLHREDLCTPAAIDTLLVGLAQVQRPVAMGLRYVVPGTSTQPRVGVRQRFGLCQLNWVPCTRLAQRAPVRPCP